MQSVERNKLKIESRKRGNSNRLLRGQVKDAWRKGGVFFGQRSSAVREIVGANDAQV